MQLYPMIGHPLRKREQHSYRHGLSMSYHVHMRIAKTVSITLPPDLLLKAQEYAQLEHRTMSELFREALRRYMSGEQQAQQWNALLQRTRAKGKAFGITTGADVERLSDKHRRDKRK